MYNIDLGKVYFSVLNKLSILKIFYVPQNFILTGGYFIHL